MDLISKSFFLFVSKRILLESCYNFMDSHTQKKILNVSDVSDAIILIIFFLYSLFLSLIFFSFCLFGSLIFLLDAFLNSEIIGYSFIFKVWIGSFDTYDLHSNRTWLVHLIKKPPIPLPLSVFLLDWFGHITKRTFIQTFPWKRVERGMYLATGLWDSSKEIK